MGLEASGYEIQEAAGGREALERMVSFLPELVVLDLGMPDLDGLTVLKALREWSNVPVVVLTVRDSEEDKVRLLEAGADDYLTKPFSFAELIVRLKVARRHYLAAQEPTPYFRTGRLEINYSDHSVRFEGELLRVTATEYKLLRLLAQGQGRVVMQSRLIEEIWGTANAESAHYLRVYVGHLRKKLEGAGVLPSVIVTEPGVGYRLNVDAL